MNKNAIGFSSLCLGMSSVYAFAINAFLVALKCISIFVCMFCIMALWNCLEAKPHCNELLAPPFEMDSGMSPSLALVGQLTRVAHMRRIIIGHSTLPTNHLLISNKHMILEND